MQVKIPKCRLHPQPESIVAAVCQFNSVAEAVLTATTALQYNIKMAKVELLDVNSIKAVNDYSKTGLAELPTLFCEFQGSETAVKVSYFFKYICIWR